MRSYFLPGHSVIKGLLLINDSMNVLSKLRGGQFFFKERKAITEKKQSQVVCIRFYQSKQTPSGLHEQEAEEGCKLG